MTDINGKIALVTGGTGGIGAAICLKLADSGAKVATNYRNEDKAKTWQEAVKKEGYDIAIYQADVSDYAACEAMVAKVVADLGPIDILVNNAGITKDGMFKKMTKDKWDAVMKIHRAPPCAFPLGQPFVLKGHQLIFERHRVQGGMPRVRRPNFQFPSQNFHVLVKRHLAMVERVRKLIRKLQEAATVCRFAQQATVMFNIARRDGIANQFC